MVELHHVPVLSMVALWQATTFVQSSWSYGRVSRILSSGLSVTANLLCGGFMGL